MVFLLQALLALQAAAISHDAVENFTQLCASKGFLIETHQATTPDGYILTLYRIPGLLNETITSQKPVAFFQHGLLDLSDTWITNEPSPGFMMAMAGFDVWFGNSRGSYHSLGHVTYNYKKDAAYWQFSWQQMAEYDLPTSVDYALTVSGASKLTYIGHSQGTLIMMAHLSEQPEFIEKINLFVALAPVWTVRHLELSIFTVLENVPFSNALADMGINDFLPNPGIPSLFYFCCRLFGLVCDSVIQVVADMQVSQDNTARFPVILAHEPGGTSTHNMQHWQQMTHYSDYVLRKFDYGEKKNQEIYGQATPPEYNLQNIPGPIAWFFGSEDRLANPIDAAWLRAHMPASSVVYTNDNLEFGHLTFVWGKEMSYFDQAIRLAQQHSANVITA